MAREFYSKPRYQELSLIADRPYHVVITDGWGKERAATLYETAAESAQCLVVSDQATATGIKGAIQLPNEQLTDYLPQMLSELSVGTQFYMFGKEQFLWPTHSKLIELHVPRSRCALQRCGPIDRDVFCTHCQHTTLGINHTPVICSGCGRLLHVYDHFSKRLGSYMGFQVNAECDTEIPEQEALHS